MGSRLPGTTLMPFVFEPPIKLNAMQEKGTYPFINRVVVKEFNFVVKELNLSYHNRAFVNNMVSVLWRLKLDPVTRTQLRGHGRPWRLSVWGVRV